MYRVRGTVCVNVFKIHTIKRNRSIDGNSNDDIRDKMFTHMTRLIERVPSTRITHYPNPKLESK